MTSDSPISNLTDLKEGETLLPVYIIKRPDGVIMKTLQLPDGAEFVRFVDRLFSNGARFVDLDYGCFLGMLYNPEKYQGAEVRIAQDIVRFPAQRSDLYKIVKILDGGKKAEYVFEPAFIEVVYDEPIYGEPGEDGTSPILRYERKTRQQPVKLNVDEFIAAMWLKGLRYGIDTEAVRKVIDQGITARIDVAFQLDPTVGKDAEIVEVSDSLRRDDSPKIMANGRTDLRRFKNRFPQIAQGVSLLRKIPRTLGNPGYKVTGEIIEPPIPEDFDLHALAGPGTKVEQIDGGEVIVSTMDGFLSLDLQSNQVSVTEKIENKGGISVKTTGDISLAVDEFIEHGEVQEGRIVEGKHMTFKSGVYGTILSHGGHILIEENLSGGAAKSIDGSVTVAGRASNATLEAWDGKVTVGFAEGCTIIGKIVTIERAVSCEIVAEELYLGISEGSAMVGKSISIASSNARKSQETVVNVILPDLTLIDQQMAQAKNGLDEIDMATQSKLRQIEAAKSVPELAKYLALGASIQKGAIKLTEAQQENWQKMTNQFARELKNLTSMNSEKQALAQKRQLLEQEVERLSRTRVAECAAVRCEIKEIQGETVVRKLISGTGISGFRDVPGNDLKSILRQHGSQQERIFSGDTGSLEWKFQAPAPTGT